MASLAEVFVTVKPDTAKFEPDLKKKLAKVDADSAAKKSGSRFGSTFSLAAGAAAAAGLVAFGSSSISAFKESELAQSRLSDAFAKFPKLADTNKAALDKLNTSLAQKTRFDDDATASGQAVLAQFGLTGSQVTQLTPLLQDYAAKTGKDLPTAANDLGKALLGQGRALKNVGINFKDAGSVGANFDQIVGGLRTQVGGFAAKEGKTATGQSEILKNQFGELQETVGSVLVPALTKLAAGLLSVIGFVQRNQDVVVPAAAAIGGLAVAVWGVNAATGAWASVQAAANALHVKSIAKWIAHTAATVAHKVALGVVRAATIAWTAAQWLLNVALSANPIGLVIAALVALGAGLVLAYQKSETFRNIVQGAWQVIQKAVDLAWNYYLKPYLTALVAILKVAWEGAQTAARIIGQAFSDIWHRGQDAWNFINRYFFAPIGLAWNTLYTAAVNAWNSIDRWVIAPFKIGLEAVKNFLDPIVEGFKWIFDKGKKLWDFLSSPFGGGGGGRGGLDSAGVTSAGRAFPLPGGKSAYRVTQGLHPVNAIDYGAPSGTPVFASFPGMLQTADLGNRSYGKYYRLTGAGKPILGAHLSRFARRSGFVSKGTLIGWTGTTGNSTGPHLHLENFDFGGVLAPGWNMVRNDTGRDEILTPVARSGSRVEVNIYAGSVIHERDLVKTIRDGLTRHAQRGDPMP